MFNDVENVMLKQLLALGPSHLATTEGGGGGDLLLGTQVLPDFLYPCLQRKPQTGLPAAAPSVQSELPLRGAAHTLQLVFAQLAGPVMHRLLQVLATDAATQSLLQAYRPLLQVTLTFLEMA